MLLNIMKIAVYLEKSVLKTRETTLGGFPQRQNIMFYPMRQKNSKI